MKQKILFIGLIILSIGSLKAQKKDPVIVQIAEVKLNVEASAKKKLALDALDGTTANRYNKIKSRWNAAISQFQYELNRKPRLWKQFDEVNQRYREGNPSASYNKDAITFFAGEIKKFIDEGNAYVNEKETPEKITSSGVDPIAVFEQVLAVYQEWRAIQGEKAKGLSEILDKLRLAELKEKEQEADSE